MAVKFYDGALASGSNNGSSWENAYRTFQAAVDGCGAGDEVWGKANSETVAATVDIDNANTPNFYGGFATSLTGTDGSVAGRDLTTARTTLNGNHARKVLAFTRNCIFDGFKVYNGAGSPAGASISGATAAVTIRNCIFDYNDGEWQGGGLNVGTSSAVVIEDTDFTSNYGTQYGAGLAHTGTGALTLRRCLFHDNDATVCGAAIHKENSGTCDFEDCTISANTITGGSWGYPGAVYLILGTTTFLRCKFLNNTSHASAWGGAIQTDGSGILQCTNCIFTGNTADYGGAVDIYAGSGTFTNCTFTGNTADTQGSAIDASGTTVITNCILYDDYFDEIAGTVTITYSDIEGGHSGTGNVNVNPNFVGTGDNPCDLASVSNVVDSGNAGATYYPSTDFLGRARVDYPGHTGTGTGTPTYSDMGAYELQAPVTAVTAPLWLSFNS